MADDYELWTNLARQLRIDSIRSTTKAGSGHPTSSLSAADLMAVLLASHFRYDFQNPKNPNNDHLIFSKGHASPLLYAMYKAAGAISEGELMSLRRFGSRLEGHPAPVLPWVDVATGSLGQGLPIGVGIALAGKYLDRLPYRVYVLLGDSEMAEGSIWEAIEHAAFRRLDNLIGILDVNRLGQRGETMLGWNTEAYARRAEAFGWRTVQIDGHDPGAIHAAYRQVGEQPGLPLLMIARTIKGKGVSFIEDKNGWHGKALNVEEQKKALAELGPSPNLTIQIGLPAEASVAAPERKPLELPRYDPQEKVATRKAYGDALRALGAARSDVVALDGEVGNSTYAEEFAKAFPERFFEMYIDEQQMVSAAVGLQVRGWVPFASTFAAFLTRAFDFIRMSAVSRANYRLCGSHAGVSIGEDGPSQMGLEDIAMMRAVHGSTVLYPCDANQSARLTVLMADWPGISFLRTTREKTPVLYGPDEDFAVGGSKTLKSGERDRAAVIAAGITVHEALKAYAELEKEGIAVRIIDAYSVKPMDIETLKRAAEETGGRLIVVEDHWAEGGLGDAVLAAFADGGLRPPRIRKLAVRKMPGSGKPDELIDAAGISAAHIVKAVKSLL